jgi:ABC-type Fe3+-siderophore transport system permease subunit
MVTATHRQKLMSFLALLFAGVVMLATLLDGRWRARSRRLARVCLTLGLLGMSAEVLAHAIAQGDKGYIQEISGVNLVAFIYLGAKHTVTGYDHLLFLLGVIFFLYRMQHIAIYVSLFALGHSTAMLLGVCFNVCT